MEINMKIHQDVDVIGDKKPILKTLILMKSHPISFLNLKEILLNSVIINHLKKVKTVLSPPNYKKKTIILRILNKWMIL